jgi:hypothetical protein
MKPFLTICLPRTSFKLILTTLLLILNCIAYAQDDGTGRTDLSPYGLKYSDLNFVMNRLSSHGFATQITYFDLNFVDGRMRDFMKGYLLMTVKKFPKFSKINAEQVLTVKYIQMATMGTTHIPHLDFKYVYFENKQKNPIIKSLLITGSPGKVLTFYTSFWPTVINFNHSKNKIAHNYLLQDKATITVNNKGLWSILVENTSIRDNGDYYRQLVNSTSTQQNLENGYSKRERIKRDSIAYELRNEHHIKDSLMNLVHAYGINLITTDNEIPSISELKGLINNAIQLLISGKCYNSNNADSLVSKIEASYTSPDKKYFSGNLLIKIDTAGLIIKVIPRLFTSSTSNQVIKTLSNHFKGKWIKPVSVAGKNYSSYKTFDVKFSGDNLPSLSMRENKSLLPTN